MTLHAKFAPSASGRWLDCTASLTIDTSHIPVGPQDPAAAVGTALHEVSELILDGKLTLAKARGKTYNGIKITQPMLDDIVKPYLDYIDRHFSDHEIRLVEVRSMVNNDIYGTSDYVAIDGNALDVIDLKTGRGRVNPEGNTQLMIYGLGIFLEYDCVYDFDTIRLHVAQPAINNFSHWEMTRKEMLDFYTDLIQVYTDILEGNVVFSESSSNCRYCPAKLICPTLHHTMLTAAQNAKTIPIAARMNLVPLLQMFIADTLEFANAQAEKGETISGWIPAPGPSSRAWKFKEEVLVEKFKALKIPRRIYQDEVILSPAALEKKLKAESMEVDIKRLVKTTPGKNRLVPDTRRRGVSFRASAADDFADIEY